MSFRAVPRSLSDFHGFLVEVEVAHQAALLPPAHHAAALVTQKARLWLAGHAVGQSNHVVLGLHFLQISALTPPVLAASPASPQVGADEQEHYGHVEDHHDLKKGDVLRIFGKILFS